ncbi:MAG: BrnT family toxin [Verrucomicrobiae bacterium]
MEFEYDPIKSQRNKQKHGIDFEQAKALWEDEDRLVIPARSETEERYAILGKIKNRIWVGFYTHRGQGIRIFSVRRAHEKEKQQYDS